MKTRLSSFLIMFIWATCIAHAYGQPSTSAPTPSQNAADVVSVFSDSYKTATNGFVPLDLDDYSLAEFTTVSGSDNNIIKLPNLGDSPARISTWDIESSLFIHIDVYSESDNGAFEFQLSNSYSFTNPQKPVGFTWPSLEKGKWVGIDIPVSAFRDAGLDLSKVLTIMFSGNGTFYIDNFYAYGKKGFVAAPKPADDLLADKSKVSSAFSDHFTRSSGAFDYQNWTAVKAEFVEKIPGDKMLYVPNLDKGNCPIFVSGWDISKKGIIYMDVYLEDGATSNDANFYFGFSNEWSANNLKHPSISDPVWAKAQKGTWVPFRIEVKSLAEMGLDVKKVISMRLYGKGTYYIDNVYAYGEYGDEIDPSTDPNIARAPMPMHLPQNVTSVFSNRYPSSASFVPQNSKAEIKNIRNSEDAVLEVPSSLIQATVAIDTWNISSQSIIHLDVYYGGNDVCEFSFQLAGADKKYKSPTGYTWPVAEKGKWISIEIPASDFAAGGLDLSAIKLLKLVGNGVYYIDNLYAYTLTKPSPDFNVRTQFGVNMSGAEFGAPLYPVYDEDWSYYQEKGLGLIRVPFKWERIQPELNGPLAEEDLAKLKLIAGFAQSKGMQLMFDMHNYCDRIVDGVSYRIDDPKTGVVTRAHLADVWKKLASEFKDYGTWGYDIMNEPYNIKVEDWKPIAQAVIDAIRTVDTKTPVVIEGCSWASADRWVELSDDLKNLTDPSNRIIFQAHCYFDKDASGTYKKSYDEEVSDPQVAIKRLGKFVKWLKDNNKIGMIGELGCPGDDVRWLTMFDETCTYLKENNVSLTYWSGGRHWGTYALDIHPNIRDFKDEKPQMKILEKYGDFYTGIESEMIETVKGSILVYPNPVTEFVKVKAEVAIKDIQLYNFMGQLMLTQSVNDAYGEQEINMSSFANGYYLIRVHLENAEVITAKVIKR